MKTHVARDFGQTALSAFRADLPPGGRVLTRSDDETIIIATLLRHAATAGKATAMRRAIGEARRIARNTLGPVAIGEGCEFDEPGTRAPIDVLRVVVDRATRQGHLAMAEHLVDSLEQIVPPETLSAGRIFAQRAMVTKRRGSLDVALVQYRQLARMGRRIGEDELVIRGLLGRAGSTWMMGNLPEGIRLTRRVARLAGDRFTSVNATAHIALAAGAALGGRYDEGINLAWTAYRLAKGNKRQEYAALANVAQILIDAGHPEPARAALEYLFSRGAQFYGTITSISAYALASAGVGDRTGVEWAVAQTLELAKARTYPRETADALLECSHALAQLGKQGRAGTMRRRALALATRYGFHDIAYLAEHGVRRGAAAQPSRMTGAARAIATRIAELEPGDVPLALMHAS